MIDLDDVSTYPIDISKWVIERKNFFLGIVPIHSYEFDYEIIHKLQNVWFDEIPEFVELQKRIKIQNLRDGILQESEI